MLTVADGVGTVAIEDNDAMRILTANQRRRGDTSNRIVSLSSTASPFVRRLSGATDGR